MHCSDRRDAPALRDLAGQRACETIAPRAEGRARDKNIGLAPIELAAIAREASSARSLTKLSPPIRVASTRAPSPSAVSSKRPGPTAPAFTVTLTWAWSSPPMPPKNWLT